MTCAARERGATNCRERPPTRCDRVWSSRIRGGQALPPRSAGRAVRTIMSINASPACGMVMSRRRMPDIDVDVFGHGANGPWIAGDLITGHDIADHVASGRWGTYARRSPRRPSGDAFGRGRRRVHNRAGVFARRFGRLKHVDIFTLAADLFEIAERFFFDAVSRPQYCLWSAASRTGHRSCALRSRRPGSFPHLVPFRRLSC